MGSDRRFRPFAPRNRYFNPRSPDGERRTSSADLTSGEQFQSTLPGWGATTIPITATALYTFQSTLPGWGATCIPCPASGSARYFNPRSPDGERHDGLNGNVWLHRISIHAPRMGSDYSLIPVCPCCRDFNPRSPDGERPSTSPRRPHIIWISIHAPRMGSDGRPECHNAIKFISIHAPRMGSDPSRKPNRDRATQISIHAPRMGSDAQVALEGIEIVAFQSTLPGWGATLPFRAGCTMGLNFNPRSPDGERPERGVTGVAHGDISIHAPRMGSDDFRHRHSQVKNISIHAPRMGSDHVRARLAHGGHISIHAPRMGSDRENGHLRPRYGQNHPFSTLIVSQIVVDVLGTVRKSQKHQRTSHYEVIKQPERRK